ncbi:Signal transduction histidine kinase [Hahella chejuensis KCTC 2396]|uniref:histidine kinase n=1 Tax=Hahella chejuensis (strain KCTC 2396) TaxID=349521 RepID=Q2SND9_HAHCH|nr:HAMP domain-containing sensor histidine kinase [Hahella chejuensis]ABC27835.1 Signal transduction histidine kinase [Hahella chejuensis KCTC 2396]
MAASLRRGLTPGRLRLFLAVLFLALLIPFSVLVWQTQQQIKWEAFHQYRLLAEELSQRIDSELQRWIAVEEAHSYADYQFLVLTGDPNTSSYVQRSPLAAFPAESSIPGLLGYFQVDAEGVFSTPATPETLDNPERWGLSVEELTQRTALRDTLLDILSQNQLVQRRRTDDQPLNLVEEGAGLADAAESSSSMYSSSSESGLGGMSASDDISSERDAEMDTLAMVEPKPTPAAPATRERKSVPEPAQEEYKAKSPPVYAQQAFDNLNSPVFEQRQRSQSEKRLDDLKLQNSFKKESAASKSLSKAAPATVQAPNRVSRIEQTALLEEVESEAAPGEPAVAAPKVKIFESEVDPLELALLDSGQFVLFRKVWRDGQRIIQGAIIEQDAFVEGAIAQAFQGTALAQMSNMVVAFQGDILQTISGSVGRGYMDRSGELNGELLHQVRLSAPLGDFQLLWTINRLPAGPGARVVIWASVILGGVLLLGFIMLYRLGLRQIKLARQQQDFVSAVSHELKTPLTSIRMYGEMLREGWVGEEKKREYYDFIHDESERLSRLIANVLQLARMERNDLKLELKPVGAQALMDMVRSKISSQVERAGFECSYELDPSCVERELHVDADAFVQVIINLVDNAIKFSAKSERKRIEIHARPRGAKSVAWSVRDYGPGVQKSQMKKIFQLFYRSGNELTRDTVGTGIGLALVRQLTRAMGGEVDVLNRTPGAEFEVVLS